MVFFSSEISGFIKSYSNLFGIDDKGEGDDNEEEEPAEEEIHGDGETDKTVSFYSWVSLLYEVSQLTLLDFNQCWEMGIYEFFNYVSFCRTRAERQRQINEQYRRELEAKYRR